MKNFFVQVSACFIATTGVCAANTGPTIDFGTVTTYQTTQLPKTPSLVDWPNSFEQKVTFTLASAANVRIDMREIGLTHWLTQYRSDLSVKSFSLLDGNQQLIGSAAADPAFTGDKVSCNFSSSAKCVGDFARGYTLTTPLEAGTYTMDLKGYWYGANMPELDFGVLVMGVGVQAAYFAALTSPTNLPEPSTWFMMALGLSAVALGAKKRRTA